MRHALDTNNGLLDFVPFRSANARKFPFNSVNKCQHLPCLGLSSTTLNSCSKFLGISISINFSVVIMLIIIIIVIVAKFELADSFVGDLFCRCPMEKSKWCLNTLRRLW